MGAPRSPSTPRSPYKNIVGQHNVLSSLFLWTYGESNPDLFHAMEPFYRYTIGPRAAYTTKNYRFRTALIRRRALSNIAQDTGSAAASSFLFGTQLL